MVLYCQTCGLILYDVSKPKEQQLDTRWWDDVPDGDWPQPICPRCYPLAYQASEPVSENMP